MPAPSEAHYQYYSEPVGQMAATATALSPDNASNLLRAPSSLTADDAAHYVVDYTSVATVTLTTNDQGCGPRTTDDDVFAGSTWSELLAIATGGPDDDSSSMIGLPLQYFEFGDFEDGLWNLDDICLQHLCLLAS